MNEQNPDSNPLDFSSVLAATVHDMKNSLSLVIQSIELLSDSIPESNALAREQLANFHYESARLNTNLVQLLSLYRSELDTLPVAVDECYVHDLLGNIVESNQLYASQRGFSVSVDCDEELIWYCDPDLIYLLLNDTVINALRYGKDKIQLTARVANNQLNIRIEDNGNGYPECMLIHNGQNMAASQVSEGRTGLGLYFAKLIAAAHANKNSKGEVILSNGGSLGGSVFNLVLP